MKTIIIEDSIYNDKKSLCDVKKCNAIKGVNIYSAKGDDYTQFGEILFLCKRHAKKLNINKEEK